MVRWCGVVTALAILLMAQGQGAAGSVTGVPAVKNELGQGVSKAAPAQAASTTAEATTTGATKAPDAAKTAPAAANAVPAAGKAAPVVAKTAPEKASSVQAAAPALAPATNASAPSSAPASFAPSTPPKTPKPHAKRRMNFFNFRRAHRDTSSDSNSPQGSKPKTVSETVSVSSENSEKVNVVLHSKFIPKSTDSRHGWRKWHRRCTPCPEDFEIKWRNPEVSWICGAYQDARRSFKSACSMRLRNCQDGTMFVRIHNHRCADDAGRGKHFFYTYSVILSDDTDASQEPSESVSGPDSSSSLGKPSDWAARRKSGGIAERKQSAERAERREAKRLSAQRRQRQRRQKRGQRRRRGRRSGQRKRVPQLKPSRLTDN